MTLNNRRPESVPPLGGASITATIGPITISKADRQKQINLDTTANVILATLPSARAWPAGTSVRVTRTGSGAFAATVAAAAGDTIAGGPSVVLASVGESVTLTATGTSDWNRS